MPPQFETKEELDKFLAETTIPLPKEAECLFYSYQLGYRPDPTPQQLKKMQRHGLGDYLEKTPQDKMPAEASIRPLKQRLQDLQNTGALGTSSIEEI